MMNRRLKDAMNRQMNRELYSSYLYMSMGGYFESIHLKGFAHWMMAQVQEELLHALRIFDYMATRDARVEMQPIEAPPINWPSPQKVFEDVLSHERMVTSMINDLVRVARSERDEEAVNALQWFVNEQVEEEQHASEVLEKCRRAKDTQSQKALDDELYDRPWPGME